VNSHGLVIKKAGRILPANKKGRFSGTGVNKNYSIHSESNNLTLLVYFQ